MDEVFIGDSLVLRRGSRNQSVASLTDLPEFSCIRGWDGEYDDDGTLLVSNFVVSLEYLTPRLVILITNRHNATGDYDSPEWEAALKAVCPKAVDGKTLGGILTSHAIATEDIRNEIQSHRDSMIIEALVDSGMTAPIAEFHSDSAVSAVLAARQEAVLARSALEFYLERPVNVVGNGWDFLQGKVA